MAHAQLVFGVLADADIEPSLVDHRRCNELAPRVLATEFASRHLGVGVKLPEELAARWLKSTQPAVAAGKDDLALPGGLGIGRAGPLRMHRHLAAIHQLANGGHSLLEVALDLHGVGCRRVVLPRNLARL